MPQRSRPDADLANDGWTPTPVYEQVNEENPDDSTFVSSPNLPPARTFVVRLNRLVPPVVGPQMDGTEVLPHRLTVRMQGSCGAEVSVTLLNYLRGHDRFIAARAFSLAREYRDYPIVLSRQEAARIEDYTTLKVLVTAFEGSSSSCSSDSSNHSVSSTSGSSGGSSSSSASASQSRGSSSSGQASQSDSSSAAGSASGSGSASSNSSLSEDQSASASGSAAGSGPASGSELSSAGASASGTPSTSGGGSTSGTDGGSGSASAFSGSSSSSSASLSDGGSSSAGNSTSGSGSWPGSSGSASSAAGSMSTGSGSDSSSSGIIFICTDIPGPIQMEVFNNCSPGIPGSLKLIKSGGDGVIVWSGGGHACGEAAKEFGITITCPADNVLRWNISNSTDVASGVVEVISAVPFHGQFLYTPGSDGCCEGRTLVIDLTEGELE